MIFEGWIPTATGNLSFSAIDNSLEQAVRVRQNLWCEGKRWAVCAQQRQNRDAQISQALFAIFSHNAVAPKPLLFLLTCRSRPCNGDIEGCLVGQIAILSVDSRDCRDYLQYAKDIEAELVELRDAYRTGLPYAIPDDNLWEGRERQIARHAQFSTNFSMLRNGKCFFEARANHTNNSTVLNWWTSQCYYFLKDTIHKHYHHHSDTDAIIEVTPAYSQPDWRYRTIRNLYRKVLQMRRYYNDKRLSDALGVLSYARCFNSIFFNVDFDEQGKTAQALQLPTYSEEIKISLEIRRDDARRSFDRRNTASQFVAGALIATIASYLALFDHFPEGSASKKFGKQAIDVLSNTPSLPIAIILVGFIIFALWTGHIDPADFSIVRRLYRIFASLSKHYVVLILLILVVLTSFGSIYMIGLAVHH